MRFVIFLFLSALAGCASSPELPGDGCEWVDPPPPLELCEQDQEPNVDENLIADCTALTRPVGDWILGLSAQGREHCPQSGW